MATKHPIRRQLSNNELLPLIAPSACIHRRLRECQRPQSTDLVRARTSQRANGTTVSSPARTDQILTAGSPRRRAPPEVRSRRGGEGFRPDVGARVQGVCRESTGSLPGVCRESMSAFFCTASSRPSPRTAASPPPRPGGGAFDLHGANLVHVVGFEQRRSKSASRPAVGRPANSIVKRLGWVGTQPSRVRSAGLRPPLTAARRWVSTLPHNACGLKWSPQRPRRTPEMVSSSRASVEALC